MGISNIENWLSELDDAGRTRKFIWNKLLAPIKFCIEIICWYRIWRRIVLPALIENDTIFGFFEKNDFVYLKWYHLSKFSKWDMVPIDNPYYAEIKDTEKLRLAIRKEYIDTFVEIIERASPLDLQNYISLQCKLDYRPLSGNIIKVYNIVIQYWRHSSIVLSCTNTIYWLIITGILWFAINTIFAKILG